jgi:catechol 2,3-dioxygenase-like lactoylglutathione lyase family enzyme
MKRAMVRGPAPQADRREPRIEGLSAVTLATGDMARAVAFYRALGFELIYGGGDAAFTTFRAGAQYLNLTAEAPPRGRGWWGRAIFYVSDVDGLYRRARERGLEPDFPPSDAAWGERYFHITDPDGHEISFARPLAA